MWTTCPWNSTKKKLKYSRNCKMLLLFFKRWNRHCKDFRIFKVITLILSKSILISLVLLVYQTKYFLTGNGFYLFAYWYKRCMHCAFVLQRMQIRGLGKLKMKCKVLKVIVRPHVRTIWEHHINTLRKQSIEAEEPYRVWALMWPVASWFTWTKESVCIRTAFSSQSGFYLGY